MPEYFTIWARCDCGGRLEWSVEQTKRGPRWKYTCEFCGCRWGHRDGVFGPLDRDPTRQLAEEELLLWFRRLPEELLPEVVSHVQALAHSSAGEVARAS
jgi:hypothetical protein